MKTSRFHGRFFVLGPEEPEFRGFVVNLHPSMTLFLTGSPTRYGEDHFTRDNGFLDAVLAALHEATGNEPPRVLLVSAAPDDQGFTESVREGMSLASTVRASAPAPS